MPRLRQQNPANYGTSANINSEFENLIRYVNRAELGDNTLGELISVLFDEDGEFIGPVEMRLDPTAGLQYRVGTYAVETDGWITLTDLASIRGTAGANVGTIGAPIIYNRLDYVATASQTVFSYAFDTTDDLLVFVNGILMTPTTDYANNPTTDQVTFVVPRTAGQVISIYSIRASAITGYNRVNTVTSGSQAVFPFIHADTDELQVFKNGILQREGGGYDYTRNAASDTVTFNVAVPSANLVSILTVQSTVTTSVTGLLMEADYSDLATGLILFSKLQIADGQVPQAKINGLVSALSDAGKLIVSSSTPTGAWLTTGRLWLDTSLTPNILKFYNGVGWLSTSPASSLPAFVAADAYKYIRLNSLGTGFIYDTVDLTSVIPITQKSAANGVATLDALGRMPSSQLPVSIGADSYYEKRAGAVANAAYVIRRIFKQKVSLTGGSFLCSTGTATIQLAVNGVGVGATYSVTSAGLDQTFGTPQPVDASTANQRIGYIITAQAGLADLEVTLAAEVLP